MKDRKLFKSIAKILQLKGGGEEIEAAGVMEQITKMCWQNRFHFGMSDVGMKSGFGKMNLWK